ncbi:hypothetical protein WJX81_004206 [Elliptochloris bilobata]|uniref:protein-serine/threonine phosphatase n=1 Tax=Elliptochloris bilobata TaxID=381761 RepID=A0AAW1R0I4_9CHLO
MGCSSSVPYSLFSFYAPEPKFPQVQGHKTKASDARDDAGNIKAAYGSTPKSWGFRESHTLAGIQGGAEDKQVLLCAVAPSQQTLASLCGEPAQALAASDVHCSAATATRAGREGSVLQRKANQDACLAMLRFQGHPGQSLFGVFDGHGPSGEKVSGFIRQHLPPVLGQLLALEAGDEAEALRRGFLEVHRRLVGGPIDSDLSGSTAVACLLRGARLTTAWAGDSRAVLARMHPDALPKRSGRPVAVPLTRDHEPCLAAEQRRIIMAGGRVERMRDERGLPVGPQRVWLAERGYPGLAMSRAIGDGLASLVGVTAEPECTAVDLTPGDRFLLLASDGVWGVLSCQAAVDIVAGCATAEQGANKLVSVALQKWLAEENGCSDDITAVVDGEDGEEFEGGGEGEGKTRSKMQEKNRRAQKRFRERQKTKFAELTSKLLPAPAQRSARAAAQKEQQRSQRRQSQPWRWLGRALRLTPDALKMMSPRDVIELYESYVEAMRTCLEEDSVEEEASPSGLRLAKLVYEISSVLARAVALNPVAMRRMHQHVNPPTPECLQENINISRHLAPLLGLSAAQAQKLVAVSAEYKRQMVDLVSQRSELHKGLCPPTPPRPHACQEELIRDFLLAHQDMDALKSNLRQEHWEVLNWMTKCFEITTPVQTARFMLGSHPRWFDYLSLSMVVAEELGLQPC